MAGIYDQFTGLPPASASLPPVGGASPQPGADAPPANFYSRFVDGDPAQPPPASSAPGQPNAPKTEPPASFLERAGRFAKGQAIAAGRAAAPYLAEAGAGAVAGGLAGGPPGALLGAVGFPAAAGLTDAVIGLGNLGSAGLHYLTGEPGTQAPQLPTIGGTIDRGLTAAGVPETPPGAKLTEAALSGGASGFLGAKGLNALAASGKVSPKVAAAAKNLGREEVAQGVSGALAAGGAQTAADMGAGPLGQAVAGLALGAAPFAGTIAGKLPRGSERPTTAGHEKAGYTVPLGYRSDTESTAEALVSGTAGKLKTEAAARWENQKNTNAKIQQAFGYEPDVTKVPVVSENPKQPTRFTALENQISGVYDQVKTAVPTIPLDGKVKDAVTKALGDLAVAREKVPELLKGSSLDKARTAVAGQGAELDTPTALAVMSELRSRARDTLRSAGDVNAQKAEARALRALADAVEDGLEKGLKDAPARYAKQLAETTAERAAKQDMLDKLPDWSEARRAGAAGEIAALDAKIAELQPLFARVSAEAKTTSGLYAKFQDARRVKAQIETLKEATNVANGNVDARVLGRDLDSGVRLTGPMRDAAMFANDHHDLTVPPSSSRSPERWSVEDMAKASGASAVLGGGFGTGVGEGAGILGALAGPAWLGARSVARENALHPAPNLPGLPLSVLTAGPQGGETDKRKRKDK